MVVHHCPGCWFASSSLPELKAHQERVDRFNEYDLAEHFRTLLHYSDGDLGSDVMNDLNSEDGYLFHNFTVWIRPMPDTIVVWAGNDVDYDMGKIAELPLV